MEQGEGESQASKKLVQVSTPVPTNVFRGTIQGTIGFTTDQIEVLAEDGYDTQESVLYWKFIDIKECYHLKSSIHASRGGISVGDRKTKCLQELDWWVTYLIMQGKNIDWNNFKSDILRDAIEEYRLDF